MKALIYMKATLVFLMMAASVFGYSLTADEIIREADEHRLVSNSFEMTIRVENYLGAKLEGITVMNGQVDNGKMSMLTFLEPLSMKGRKIIIKDNDMRLTIPNVKNPIRITASQKLVGGISYGDIAAISYAESYTAKLIGEEKMAGMNSDGTKSDAVQCFVLELSAKETTPNYSKIILWVDRQNNFPVKGDFFVLSGKKMTTVYYTSPQEWLGKSIITKMFLFDQINTSKYFSMEYFDFKVTSKGDN